MHWCREKIFYRKFYVPLGFNALSEVRNLYSAQTTNCSAGRIRTCDLRGMSPASWPLLYRAISGPAKTKSLTSCIHSANQAFVFGSGDHLTTALAPPENIVLISFEQFQITQVDDN